MPRQPVLRKRQRPCLESLAVVSRRPCDRRTSAISRKAAMASRQDLSDFGGPLLSRWVGSLRKVLLSGSSRTPRLSGRSAALPSFPLLLSMPTTACNASSSSFGQCSWPQPARPERIPGRPWRLRWVQGHRNRGSLDDHGGLIDLLLGFAWHWRRLSRFTCLRCPILSSGQADYLVRSSTV